MPFPCYRVAQDEAGAVSAARAWISPDDLPAGDVLIEVEWSSLNYKDALAATGNPGVVRRFPHVPGIDLAGRVVESAVAEFVTGDDVLVTGYDLGAGRWGGWSAFARVPADWIVRRPPALSSRDSMVVGTAGFTAALAVESLVAHGVRPESGEVVVTGASGGVGVLAVKLLGQLGYRAVAVSGKPDCHARLLESGATRVLDRSAVDDRSDKPLLGARWAGGIDTVGGNVLGTLLRETQPGGCVAACGLVGGRHLPVTVLPFLLRGVTLAGIDSAWCPLPHRRAVWEKLAGMWRLRDCEAWINTATLDDLGRHVEAILRGQIAGRVVVQPTSCADDTV